MKLGEEADDGAVLGVRQEWFGWFGGGVRGFRGQGRSQGPMYAPVLALFIGIQPGVAAASPNFHERLEP